MKKVEKIVSKKLEVKDQFNNIKDFKASGYLQKIAKNFDRGHLLEDKFNRLESAKGFISVMVVDADPINNYGLDFKLYYYYRIVSNNECNDQLMISELNLSGTCISSAPLQKVLVDVKGSRELFDAIDKIATSISDGQIIDFDKEGLKKMQKEVNTNRDNNIFESITYYNTFYKKDLKYRRSLVELSVKGGVAYA